MLNKVALHTLGCKLNFTETSTIGNQFLNNGYKIVDFKEEADIYVFNTCTVTESAEKECRQLVRRALRKNPNAYVIITGCYAQLRPEDLTKIDGVDAVLGSNEKFDLFSILDSFEKNSPTCVYVSSTDNLKDFGIAYSTDADSRTRAYLKIQDGCDYKCTFCTIPLARGSSRSMKENESIKEFEKLVNTGYKEIILTGVNVGDYGKSANSNLYNLLTKLILLDGEYRIRISSIEPNLLTDEILELVAGSNKLCKHFHIPLQSGSPRILRAMQRRYTIGEYESLIIKAKDRIENLSIGVDVIVGFPGEEEEDFITTHNFLRDLPLSYLHVFSYSERPDTVAATMQGKIKTEERKRRSNILRILSEKKRQEFYRSMIGKKLEVLFEAENKDGKMKGFSSNYVKIVSDVKNEIINSFTEINITGLENSSCTGNLVATNNSVELFH
jgi:threonylcarbamoyladenosine tRNA methylthiotransferase MtaB